MLNIINPLLLVSTLFFSTLICMQKHSNADLLLAQQMKNIHLEKTTTYHKNTQYSQRYIPKDFTSFSQYLLQISHYLCAHYTQESVALFQYQTTDTRASYIINRQEAEEFFNWLATYKIVVSNPSPIYLQQRDIFLQQTRLQHTTEDLYDAASIFLLALKYRANF